MNRWLRSADHRLAFSPDGQIRATGSGNKVQLRNVSTGELVETIELDSDTAIYGFAFSPVDKGLAIGTSNHTELWNLASRTKEWGVPIEGGQVVFSSDGKSLAVRAGEFNSTSVSVVKVTDGQLKFSSKSPEWIKFTCFTDEDESINIVQQHPDVAILNLKSGKKITIEGVGRIDDPSEKPSARVAITSDLSTLAISHFSYGNGDRAGEIRLVNAVTGKPTGDCRAISNLAHSWI